MKPRTLFAALALGLIAALTPSARAQAAAILLDHTLQDNLVGRFA